MQYSAIFFLFAICLRTVVDSSEDVERERILAHTESQELVSTTRNTNTKHIRLIRNLQSDTGASSPDPAPAPVSRPSASSIYDNVQQDSQVTTSSPIAVDGGPSPVAVQQNNQQETTSAPISVDGNSPVASPIKKPTSTWVKPSSSTWVTPATSPVRRPVSMPTVLTTISSPTNKPTRKPQVITDTSKPSRRPRTRRPTREATNAPIVRRTREPASDPTNSPRRRRTRQPTTVTSIPTSEPSAQVSDISTSVPSDVMTSSPTSFQQPTQGLDGNLQPTSIPTLSPTKIGTSYVFAAANVTIEFVGVTMLNDTEIDQFETITEDWFMEYYRLHGNLSSYPTEELTKYLIENQEYPETQIQDMELNAEVTRQQISDFTNLIHLNLFLSYVKSNKIKSRPIQYLQTPFKDSIANEDYGQLLRESIPSFSGVLLPVSKPKVGSIEGQDSEAEDTSTQPIATVAPIATTPTSTSDSGNASLLSFVALIGIGVCGLIIIAVCFFVLYKIYTRPKGMVTVRSTVIDDDNNTFSSPIPMSGIHCNHRKYYNLKNDDANSINGGKSYAGNSVASKDFDYTKIGRKAGHDDATFTSGAESNIFETDPACRGRDEIVLFAPSGKLGLFIDVSDAGPPVICSIQDDSVLKEQIEVGDLLISIDDVDVRKCTPTEVSELIAERNFEPLRQIILARKRIEREMASNVAPMSDLDSDNDTDYGDVVSVLDEVALYR